MDIGTKIKNARLAAGLTQEQAAGALGVSRQTVSNWENGKTYPDIISVVKMSDLYHVTLDHLLKEESPVTEYLEYLEESTDTVKSKRNIGKLIIIATCLVIYAIAMILFWCIISGSDAMGYYLIVIGLVLPVTTFVLSILIGINDYWGRWKWLSAVIFGIMYTLAEYATFKLANTIAFGNFNLPNLTLWLIGAIISLAGLGIGTLVRRHIRKKRMKCTNP
ncbi:MAG: helix-turn-helix domain-containing protein [Oscillospiraceae bacterium]|nr:helix-turn-helix domain-containing protein [Oscillospiraceae bacterium]